MKLSTVILLFYLFSITSSFAQDGKEIFETKCNACHSIGGGKGVGPDLNNVTSKYSEQWLHSFTKNSDEFIKSGDKQAKAIFEEYNGTQMPNFELSEEELNILFAHIKASSHKADKNIVAVLPNLKVGDVKRGHQLFSGAKKFEKGGVACNACHAAGAFPGGTLAKDLTNSGFAVKSIMFSLPFPAMIAAYEKHQLSVTEIADITAYLNQTNQQKAEKIPCLAFPIAGVLGVILLLIAFTIIWRKRKKGTVNEAIL